jgi:hypothetical protein
MKGTENTRVDILSRKSGYEKRRGEKSSFIFRKNRDDLILNRKQLVSTIRIDCDLFIDKIKSAYNGDIIAG